MINMANSLCLISCLIISFVITSNSKDVLSFEFSKERLDENLSNIEEINHSNINTHKTSEKNISKKIEKPLIYNKTEIKKDLNEINQSIEDSYNFEKEVLETFNIFGYSVPFSYNSSLNDNSDTDATKKNIIIIYKQIPLFHFIKKENEEPLNLVVLKDTENNLIEGTILYRNGEILKIQNLEEYKFTDYPNIDLEDAEQMIKEHFSLSEDIFLNSDSELFYINKANYPIIRFFTSLKEYYMNLVTGQIFIENLQEEYLKTLKEQEEIKKAKEIPITLNEKTGELIIHSDEINSDVYSNEEILLMEKDIEETNKAIREGLLKFDSELNTIFDKRK